MKIIGLTGRSGSGKSAVSALYRQLGYTVADADLVARQVLEPGSPCLAKLAEAFGDDLLTPEGTVNRQLLADRAFRDEASTQKLVSITHPEIIARLLAAADEAKRRGEALFFVDGAVIVGAPFEKHCDAIWLVSAPYEQSVARIRKRDGLTLRQARARLAAQLPVRALRKVAAREIRNDKDLEHLRSQAVAALEQEKGGA